MSKQFRILPFLINIFFKKFYLSVQVDTFSFNYYYYFFSYLSNLSVINLTDFERSASNCLLLICVCLFWSTKLRIVSTCFSKFFKQFKRTPLQSSLSKAGIIESVTLITQTWSRSGFFKFFCSSDVLEPSLKSPFFDDSKYYAILSVPSTLVVKQWYYFEIIINLLYLPILN